MTWSEAEYDAYLRGERRRSPLVSPVLVWAMLVFQVFDTPPVVAPASVRVGFLIGPPLSVTALSAWELRRLRTRHGLTVRGALGRERADGPRPRPGPGPRPSA